MHPVTNSAGQGLANFFSPHYQAHNRACLAHLESLALPLSNRRVLDLGSGPGDHTEFYLRRQCSVVSVDARQDCLDALKLRHPNVQTVLCDLNSPARLRDLGPFQVIHCYGILYHLEKPSQLLAYMGEACSELAIVQTCVLGDKGRRVETVEERVEDYTQSSTGRGCRPTRQWVFEELGRFFPFVYHTRTQPNHPEFPVDWNALGSAPPLVRSIFVASKQPLDMSTLSPELLDIQERLDPQAYVAELEFILAEQLTVLQEREQLIKRLHDEAAVLRSTAEAGLREMQRLREEAEHRGETIRDLERIAAERLDLLVANDRAAAEARAEADRREAALRELTDALRERDRLIMELQSAIMELQSAAQPPEGPP